MGPRNLIILFISTVAVSLVLLILFFSLFFKNVDLSFDTKLPDAAPDLSSFYKDGKPSETKGDSINRANINVPANSQPAPAAGPSRPASGLGDEDLNRLEEHDEEVEPSPETDSNALPPTGSAPLAPTSEQKTDAAKPSSKTGSQSAPAGTTASPIYKQPSISAPVPGAPTPKPAPMPKPKPSRIELDNSTPPSNPAPAGPADVN